MGWRSWKKGVVHERGVEITEGAWRSWKRREDHERRVEITTEAWRSWERRVDHERRGEDHERGFEIMKDAWRSWKRGRNHKRGVEIVKERGDRERGVDKVRDHEKGLEMMKEGWRSWKRSGYHERGVKFMKDGWISWKMDGFHERVLEFMKEAYRLWKMEIMRDGKRSWKWAEVIKQRVKNYGRSKPYTKENASLAHFCRYKVREPERMLPKLSVYEFACVSLLEVGGWRRWWGGSYHCVCLKVHCTVLTCSSLWVYIKKHLLKHEVRKIIKDMSRNRIHERKISLRFLCIVLRVLRLEL